jgi:zinc protease
MKECDGNTVYIKLTGPFVYTRNNTRDLGLLIDLVNIKLLEKMREEKGELYGVGAHPEFEHYPTPSYGISFGWGCAPENVDGLIKTMWGEIDNIKANGCDDKDLLKVKETAIRDREARFKENNYWTGTITECAYNDEDILEILNFNDYVNSLKSDDFKRAANQYLMRDNVATFVLMPAKK